ncbi:hypothetical protein PHLCEN_2v8529 [Hermanssonia centrifuga]|uniref:Uncharacterized protein n=1 Tax=Hermanssonia centrifuga TaxID=98765 RepID=A0A2R6NTH1_9APHY|nr:hypothetical protein PHLCEN_2v8529 [Hermanssonia centrifuga]
MTGHCKMPYKAATEGSNTAAIVEANDPSITTTSITGTPSSPTTEDEHSNRRPLAERLLPKPRKTGVDDMLDTPDVPTLARVMRVDSSPRCWSVQVTSTPSRGPSSLSSSWTKKQRQNSARHAANKAAKVEIEAERLARLQREPEMARIAEQQSGVFGEEAANGACD